MPFKDIFPGLSRTLGFNFQDQSDFLGISTAWNFRLFSREKIQDFPRLSRRRENAASYAELELGISLLKSGIIGGIT